MTLKRTLTTAFLFLFAISVALCQDFEVYVSDAGTFTANFKMVKFDENGEHPEDFTTEQLSWPQDIVFLEDQGVALISNLSSGNIAKHDINTGAFIENFATGIGGPTRMKIGADSLLYVLEWQMNGKVLRYELDGTFVGEFSSVGVTQSIGFDWDDAGNLYVSSFGGGTVRKFDPEGNDLGLFASTNLSGPTNIHFMDNGDLIVFDWNAGSIKRFDSEGNYQGIFISGLSNPEGIDFLPNGNMLIGNGGNGSVKEYDIDGNFIQDFIAPGGGGLQTPNAVIIREIVTTAVEEPEVANNLIAPTIGKTFYLNNPIDPDISSIEVFDSAGNLVEQPQTRDQMVWNADNFSDGLYLIVITAADGTAKVQKVIVK